MGKRQDEVHSRHPTLSSVQIASQIASLMRHQKAPLSVTWVWSLPLGGGMSGLCQSAHLETTAWFGYIFFFFYSVSLRDIASAF